MFDKMKQLMEMQKKVQELKKQLEESIFEVISSDNAVHVTMNAAQEIKEIRLNIELKEEDKQKLERALKEAYNKAVKRAQQIAAEKMKGMTGLNLPGF